MDKTVIGILVKNESGVLNRVTGLFSKRGFNIDSLSVGETENKSISRITITTIADEHTRWQIVKQLEKLVDVKKVQILETDDSVLRELLLVKIGLAASNRLARSEVMEAINVFRGKVIDMTPEFILIEVTGASSKIDAFIDYLKQYNICELCRTGATAIERGSKILSEGK